jgi:hypothetical protein
MSNDIINTESLPNSTTNLVPTSGTTKVFDNTSSDTIKISEANLRLVYKEIVEKFSTTVAWAISAATMLISFFTVDKFNALNFNNYLLLSAAHVQTFFWILLIIFCFIAVSKIYWYFINAIKYGMLSTEEMFIEKAKGIIRSKE